MTKGLGTEYRAVGIHTAALPSPTCQVDAGRQAEGIGFRDEGAAPSPAMRNGWTHSLSPENETLARGASRLSGWSRPYPLPYFSAKKRGV